MPSWRKWALASAAQGYQDAYVVLAAIYSDGGNGVERDPTEARKWWLKAARKRIAQYEMGLLTYTGDGGPKSLVEARQWFLKAAEQVAKKITRSRENGSWKLPVKAMWRPSTILG